MYICNNCNKLFDKLHQYYIQSEDKMYQVCPKCKSESVILERNIPEKERRRILRKKKLERVLNENFIVKFFKLF